MLKEKKRVRYEELTFKDDFIFCKVLENNPELCRELLELILGRRVGELVKVDQQKTIRVTQDHDIELQDGSEIILLCTEGFQDDVSPGMKAFLRYVSGNAAEGDFTERLDKAVEVTKRDPRWRLEYMNLQEMIEERHREDQEYIEMLKQENGALEQENGALEQEIDVLRKQMAELREKLTAYQSGDTDASLHV